MYDDNWVSEENTSDQVRNEKISLWRYFRKGVLFFISGTQISQLWRAYVDAESELTYAK